MDITRKIDLLRQQIVEAKNGYPDDFGAWKRNTEVILRKVLGDEHLQVGKFTKVRYTPQVMYSGQDTSGYRPAGVKNGIGVLNAAILDLELSEELEAELPNEVASNPEELLTKIFIVHGHDEARKYETARFLEHLTSEKPVILHEQANRGQVLIEKFERSAGSTGFAVILATADDLGRAKAGDEQARARQNVVFEWGFFLGAIGRERVAVLYDEGIEEPGDMKGIVYIPLDSAGGWKSRLATEIDAAGIPVRWEALGGNTD